MRIRGMLIALAVLAVLGGGVYWSNKEKKAEESKPAADAPPKVLSIPQDQLRQIEIRRKNAEPTVVRRSDSGKWEMTAPKPLPVDQDAMSSMASTLSSLDAGRLVEEKAADLGEFGLVSPSLELAITKKDGKVQKLLIGDDSPAGGGSFTRLDGDPRVFTIAAFNKTSLDKSARDLRDKRMLTVDTDKLARLELTAKGATVEFGRNTQNEWQIIKPRPLRADGGLVEELIRKLKDAKMDTGASADDDKKATAAFATAAKSAMLRVTDTSGTQELEIHKDAKNDYYARSSVVEGAHKLAGWSGESLEKGLDDFRNKKLFDFGWNDPSKVEIRDGAKETAFQKSGDKWMSGGKQMDSPSVQSVVDKLRDLAAIKFVERGFGTASFEATVTSGDGKRVEKVLVSKSGNSYFAMRDREPSIYELDGKLVEELQKAVSAVKEYQPPKDAKKK